MQSHFWQAAVALLNCSNEPSKDPWAVLAPAGVLDSIHMVKLKWTGGLWMRIWSEIAAQQLLWVQWWSFAWEHYRLLSLRSHLLLLGFSCKEWPVTFQTSSDSNPANKLYFLPSRFCNTRNSLVLVWSDCVRVQAKQTWQEIWSTRV